MSALLQQPCPSRRVTPFSGQRARQTSPSPPVVPSAIPTQCDQPIRRSIVCTAQPEHSYYRAGLSAQTPVALQPSTLNAHESVSSTASNTASTSTSTYQQPHFTAFPAGVSAADRRTMLLLTSSLVTSFLSSIQLPQAAAASEASTSQPPAFIQRGMSKYIKKKRYDPLDTYVPLVLEAKDQLELAGQVIMKHCFDSYTALSCS